MKIPEHYSLKVARQVVNKIDLPKEIAKDCWVESWSNGREQGLHISRFMSGKNGETDRAINVAQQRWEDNIMVCWGKHSDFDYQTNQESDEVWNHQDKHFKYNEQDKAAKFIARYLSTGKV